jgi:hypothetical protein
MRVDNLQLIARLMANKDRHPDKDIRKAIKDAEHAGWKADKSNGAGHRWGTLSCGSGCEVAIWSTPRRPGDIAKRIREAVKKCDHNPGTPNTVKQQKSK